MSKTHWKKLHNPNYIGAYSLMDINGKPTELNVVIKSVSKKLVPDSNGKEGECIVADLANQKPMIINSTNAKTLSKLFNSPMVEDWAGKPITLYIAKIRAFGETVDALRIKNVFPEGLPELSPSSTKWDAAVLSIKEKKTTIEKIKLSYNLSKENELLLTK